MKSKIIKKFLAGLVLAATMATVSGSVGAVPPYDIVNVYNFVSELRKDREKADLQTWNQKYSKNNVVDIVNNLKQAATDPWDRRAVAEALCCMGEFGLLDNLAQSEVLTIVQTLKLYSNCTFSDIAKAEEKLYGYHTNMAYLKANSYGFSDGDVARTYVQDVVKMMVDKKLFSGLNSNQILDVVKVLKSCTVSEIYGAKSNGAIAERLKSMLEMGLFDNLGEEEIGSVLDILDELANDGFIVKLYKLDSVLEKMMESGAKYLTYEVKSRCENIYYRILKSCSGIFDKFDDVYNVTFKYNK